MPDDLVAQLPYLPRLMTALGLPYLISHVVHADVVVQSARAKALVQEALTYLTAPSQRAAGTVGAPPRGCA